METTKNNVNNMDSVHIIFENLIVTTLNTITANSNIKRVIFESSLHRRRHGSQCSTLAPTMFWIVVYLFIFVQTFYNQKLHGGVGPETTKNNVNNLDCVHIIFEYLIATTLITITVNSYMKRVIFESSLHWRRHGS